METNYNNKKKKHYEDFYSGQCCVKTLLNLQPGHHLENIKDIRCFKIEKLFLKKVPYLYLFRQTSFSLYTCLYTEANW